MSDNDATTTEALRRDYIERKGWYAINRDDCLTGGWLDAVEDYALPIAEERDRLAAELERVTRERAALSGVGVEQYLAARDAATRERERANRAERERDEARAERDRLARILAVERGDESQAPEGWSRPGGRWVGAGGVSVMRGDAPGGGQAWTSFGWDGRHLGWYPCALEAMEAAEAARGVSDG